MLYARKITEDGWFGKEELFSDSISELTVDNQGLSVWEIKDASNSVDVDTIALALAMINHKVEEFYMVLLDPVSIEKEYRWVVAFIPQTGNTKYSLLKDAHTNFLVPTFWEIGYLAEHIHRLIKDESNYRYYDVNKLKQLAYDAAKQGRITKKDISGTQWTKVIKEIEQEQGVIDGFWE